MELQVNLSVLLLLLLLLLTTFVNYKLCCLLPFKNEINEHTKHTHTHTEYFWIWIFNWTLCRQLFWAGNIWWNEVVFQNKNLWLFKTVFMFQSNCLKSSICLNNEKHFYLVTFLNKRTPGIVLIWFVSIFSNVFFFVFARRARTRNQ